MILRPSRPTDPRLVLGSALIFLLALGANLAARAQSPSRQPAADQTEAPQAPANQPLFIPAPLPSIVPAPTPPPQSDIVPVPTAPSPSDADALKQHDQELEAARAQQRATVENQAKLKRQIEALSADRRQLNQQLIDSAARVRGVEASIEATQTRLAPLDQREGLLQKSLNARRAVIAEILAALQRIGQQPPPALLVRPEDALQAVRTAITLSTVVPEMRTQADALASDLASLMRVREQIAGERTKLSGELNQLHSEQQRLNVFVGERQKKQAVAEQALESEQQHATQLAQQVDNLKDLIVRLGRNLGSAGGTAQTGPGSVEQDATRPELAALGDPGRLAPAVAFAETRGHLHLPVNGVKIRVFGDSNGAGGTQKGLSIATRGGAQITAPCDGWVVYAGPFRSYGQLLILNAGGGYHVVLAGMERISVDLGQFVLTGEPVAAMGGGSQQAPAFATRSREPVLYVEFRKDGTPIDPSPWWAANEGEKVRG
jgi:septal ring factor EnvC (AmiA/AmiB activator)